MHVTVTDLLVTVSAAALVRHPELNVSYTEQGLARHGTANVGIAAATDRGLVVPVVHGAERLTLAEVARARAEVVGRAREGKLHREDVEGGTFTISNLGMFGLDQFTAVLNPPEAAILAVGATQERSSSGRGDGRPADDDDDADLRPPRRRRRARSGFPRVAEGDARGARARSVSAPHRPADRHPPRLAAGRPLPPRHAASRVLLALGGARARATCPVSRYVEGWGRPGDRALILIEGFQPVAAAWYRLFTSDAARLRLRRRADTRS